MSERTVEYKMSEGELQSIFPPVDGVIAMQLQEEKQEAAVLHTPTRILTVEETAALKAEAAAKEATRRTLLTNEEKAALLGKEPTISIDTLNALLESNRQWNGVKALLEPLTVEGTSYLGTLKGLIELRDHQRGYARQIENFRSLNSRIMDSLAAERSLTDQLVRQRDAAEKELEIVRKRLEESHHNVSVLKEQFAEWEAARDAAEKEPEILRKRLDDPAEIVGRYRAWLNGQGLAYSTYAVKGDEALPIDANATPKPATSSFVILGEPAEQADQQSDKKQTDDEESQFGVPTWTLAALVTLAVMIIYCLVSIGELPTKADFKAAVFTAANAQSVAYSADSTANSAWVRTKDLELKLSDASTQAIAVANQLNKNDRELARVAGKTVEAIVSHEQRISYLEGFQATSGAIILTPGDANATTPFTVAEPDAAQPLRFRSPAAAAAADQFCYHVETGEMTKGPCKTSQQ